MDKPRHLHPLQMLTVTAKYLFLLLLPLTRVLLSLSGVPGTDRPLRGGWVDLLILVFILLCSYLTWWGSAFSIENGVLFIKNGLFCRREAVIPLIHITSLSVESPWYLVPLGARRVSIHTAGHTRKNPNFRLLLYRRDAEALLNTRLINTPPPLRPYRPRWRHLLFLAVFLSNTATGVIFLITVFHRAGLVIGEAFQEQLIDELEHLAGLVDFLPQTAALVALILLIGWGIVILRHLLSHFGFSVTREPQRLHIRKGFLVRQDITVNPTAVNYLDLRQSMLSRWLRLYVVFLHTAGTMSRDTEPVLLPAVSARHVNRVTRQLLWALPRGELTVRPAKNALFRYIRLPLLTCALIPPAVFLLMNRFPGFSDAIQVFGLMALLPAVWWLMLAAVERRIAGVGSDPTGYTLCYARGFMLHTVVIPRARVRAIGVRQSPFQRMRGRCDLLLYTHHRRRPHRVRQLEIQSVYDLLQQRGVSVC